MKGSRFFDTHNTDTQNIEYGMQLYIYRYMRRIKSLHLRSFSESMIASMISLNSLNVSHYFIDPHQRFYMQVT